MNIRKIIDYLSCNEDYTWRFPPQFFYMFAFVFILVSTIITLCDPKKNEVKHLDMSIEMDSTRVDSVYQAEEVILENDSVFMVPKGHHWISKEIGLPIGIVYMMDYAGRESKNDKDHNQADNYVTVKRTDGSLSVTRDIDVDLYLSLVKGDTIR
jgi:hypothetical protein